MSEINLNDFFNGEKNDFDTENPGSGHEARFLKKLEAQKNRKSNNNSWWKPFIGIAASITFILVIIFSILSEDKNQGLASVSNEMAETEDFFATTLNEQLKKLQDTSVPETKKLVSDALVQISALEQDYEVLKEDLIESGNDSRVISAMIENYQNRIDVLKKTMELIDMFKELNRKTNQTIKSNI